MKKGTLKIFFQPAEETLKGAVESYKSGIFDDVEIALELYIRPVQDLKAGDMCAAAALHLKLHLSAALRGAERTPRARISA